jgi:flagellar assembly protein FliH
MLDRYREQILEILILIAEKVIHRQVQLSPDVILDTVRAASGHLMETEEVRVRLNPSDFEYIREIEDILSKKLTSRKNIIIVDDSSIGRGGAVIETEFGDIDATIRSQIEHLKDVLFDNA